MRSPRMPQAGSMMKAISLFTGRNDLDHDTYLVAPPDGVRRLTPLECERLQGFPCGWTEFSADGKEISDSHRYRMMGNAVAVPVIEWLGHRIAATEKARVTGGEK